MQLHTAPPLLVALGLRIFLNYMNPAHTDGTPDHILHGLWQGVLLYHTLKHIQLLVFPAGFALNDPVSAYWQWTTDAHIHRKASVCSVGVAHEPDLLPH